MPPESVSRTNNEGLSCPIELNRDVPHVTLAHGDGGRLTRQLVREHIANRLANVHLQSLDDAACLPQPVGPLAVTTDSFVVTPLFFPGGDIGSLAVYGTVNDLAVSGAHPCGPVGQHGIAVMAARERLSFDPAPHSDSQPLVKPIRVLREQLGSRVKAMRDATRGGVAAVLHEWAEAARVTLAVEQATFPMTDELRGLSELLGVDPLYFAGEGVAGR